MSSSGRKSIGIGIRKRLLGEIDLWSLDLNELPRCTQSKKRTQVIRIGISKVPGTDQTETKITFGKAQHAAEVVGGIVNVACRSVGRDYEQGNAKSIHIGLAPAGCRNRRRRNMVVPAAPIVPRNKDRSVLPVHFAIGAGSICSNRVDDRRNPRGTCAVAAAGMIRCQASGRYPNDVSQVAG